jgi:hypothetical protein
LPKTENRQPTKASPEIDPARLVEAAGDFRFLLGRDYPRQAALSLVGNRYNLDRTARQLLHRGVFAKATAAPRRAKLRRLAELTGQPLALDGHNVLITLECARRGLPLILADDGFIRDVGQVSRAFRPSPASAAALSDMAAYLAAHHIGPVEVFYDAPLSLSGQLARHTQEIMAAYGLDCQARAVASPERHLAAFPGPMASSDTALIDAHPAVVDLAGEIIRSSYPARIISLAAAEPEEEKWT